MKLKPVILGVFAASIFKLAALSQSAPVLGAQQDATATEQDASNDRTTTIMLSDRGNLPIPTNLKELKVLSLNFWIKFRATNQQVYRFVNETAQFHAYTQVCKRHSLNVSMTPLLALSSHYIQAAIPAHYDEPEYGLLEPLSTKRQQEFLEEMAGELYAFEFGYRVAEQTRTIADSDQTKKAYCLSVEGDFKSSYIALKATAMRRLAELDNPSENK